ncbi:cell division protein FtsA [Candidatus Pelagibacter sp.]|nr:cell division protein FtsA [Candidatus Pelagibacter sp.]
MNEKFFDVYFDYGESKIRAAAFKKGNLKNFFFTESRFYSDNSFASNEIEKIVSSLEKDTNEYLNDINIMVDSSQMLPISISITKKFDQKKLENHKIQFLIQDAKQQILNNYSSQNIIHIIILRYRINDIEYFVLPDDVECERLSIDILFICLPKKYTDNIKKLFSKFDISINNILCSSYAKSLNYKNNFEKSENLLFVDMGFNKTSMIFYNNNNFISFDVLPIGGNHITKDISKILKINLEEAEKIKLNFDKDENFLKEKKLSIELVQRIIFSRIEEILELSTKALHLKNNLNEKLRLKIILMGEGAKILDNKFKEKISFSKEINLLDESANEICESGFKLRNDYNKQEVVLIPKTLKKVGFFEKFFHLFR